MIPNMEGAWSAREGYAMIINRVGKTKSGIHGKVRRGEMLNFGRNCVPAFIFINSFTCGENEIRPGIVPR